MMKKLLKYILPVLTVVASGCGSEEVAPPAVEEPSQELQYDEVMLCLNVSYDGVGSSTRAEGDPDRYEGIDGKYETVETLRVLIVRDIQTDADGKTTAVVEGNRLVATNEQGYPMYDNLEFKVLANSNKRIYLIANEKYLPNSPITGQKVSVFLDSYTVSTPKEEKRFDIGVLSGWTVSVPDITASTTTVTTDKMGMFQPSDGKRLPLTEFFDVEVGSKDETTDNRWFSHLFLTRCAAKAQFFLKTSDAFAAEEMVNTRITAITLEGVGTSEYVFPNKAEYAPHSKNEMISNSGADIAPTWKEAYIKSFTTPIDNKTVTYSLNNVNVEIKKPSVDSYPITNYIYFPESILTSGNQYVVGVQFNGENWFYAPLETNILNIEGRDAIARNSYLPIELEFGESAELSVRVLPWNREDYYVDYTANIGFTDEGYLDILGTAGQTGDYLLLDKTAAQLVLNYGKVARGKFYISSPLAAQWDAYMITTGGVTNAIQFQIPDPEDSSKTITTTHISGKVGENEADFGIVATVAPGDQQNSAQLMVIVTLANGTPVVANVLGETWGEDRLTIIENPL